VYCQLEALRHCLPPSLRGILDELPDTLDETYERVLKEINKANREHARRLLQCLTVALRPLRVEELAEVLAIDFAAPAHGGIPQLNPNWRWTDHHQAVLSTCSSLITIVDDGDFQVVQFSHFSVKEFLTSDRLARSGRDISRYHIALEPAHTILAQACFGVLLRLDDRVIEDNIDEIPLVEYASQHMFDHAGFEKVASHIRVAMEYFFDADKPHWTAWSRVQKIDVRLERFTPSASADALPLYYMSLGGFYDLAEHLVGKHPEQINARGGQMVTPLFAALRRKHFQIAELLHWHGADVNVRGGSNFTSLHAACVAGIVDIVEWLLNHGADVNTQANEGSFPISVSVAWGHLQVVRMLIEFNADIDVRREFGRGLLHMAIRCKNDDHVGIMRLLLDHGANPNARDDYGSTPLHHSSESWWKGRGGGEGYIVTRGTVEGTCLLLKYGAIIDAEDNKGRTPLQVALDRDRQDIATCLREHSATR
jgi:ankyrin repeat protein